MRWIILFVGLCMGMMFFNYEVVKEESLVQKSRFPDQIMRLVHIEPAGPIVDGVRIEQPIIIDEDMIGAIRDLSERDVLRIKVFMASYARTNNEGRVCIGIKQDDVIVSDTLNVRLIKDNAFHSVDLNNPLGKNFKAGVASLFIEGIDSPADRSVTVWLTSDTPFGGAFINGVKIQKGLQFKLSVMTYSAQKRMIIISLIAIASISVLFLSMMAFRRS